MQPPFIQVKTVHDEQIREALERHRFDAEQEPSGQGLLQAFGQMIGRRFGAQTGEAASAHSDAALPEGVLAEVQALLAQMPIHPNGDDCDAASKCA